MEHAEYQGFDILIRPSLRTHPTVAVCWFDVGQGKEEEFGLEMRVSNRFAFTNTIVTSTEDPQEIARVLGLRWVHGVIDLRRYERGQTFSQERLADWDPHFGEPVSDEDLELELLRVLRRMTRAQQNTSTILSLDVDGVSDVLGVNVRRVRELLGEMQIARTIEGYAETFGHAVTEGACRLTRDGLRRLQDVEKSHEARSTRFPSATPTLEGVAGPRSAPRRAVVLTALPVEFLAVRAHLSPLLG